MISSDPLCYSTINTLSEGWQRTLPIHIYIYISLVRGKKLCFWPLGWGRFLRYHVVSCLQLSSIGVGGTAEEPPKIVFFLRRPYERTPKKRLFPKKDIV